MRKPRKKVSGTEKVAALRRHLLEGVPISTLCDELGVAPSSPRAEPGTKAGKPHVAPTAARLCLMKRRRDKAARGIRLSMIYFS